MRRLALNARISSWAAWGTGTIVVILVVWQPMTTLSGKRILVTGPAGQIAFPLVRELARDNEVWGIARFGDPATRDKCEAVGCTTRVVVARGRGDGACATKKSSSSCTPKLLTAEPKNTGVCRPAR